jgi:hypothetical protein
MPCTEGFTRSKDLPEIQWRNWGETGGRKGILKKRNALPKLEKTRQTGRTGGIMKNEMPSLLLTEKIYPWRKVVCFVIMRSTELGCLKLCSWFLWKSLDEEGCMGLVPWHLHLGCKSFWILNFFSLKIKLNRSWKFRRIWNVPLVGKILMSRI